MKQTHQAYQRKDGNLSTSLSQDEGALRDSTKLFAEDGLEGWGEDSGTLMRRCWFQKTLTVRGSWTFPRVPSRAERVTLGKTQTSHCGGDSPVKWGTQCPNLSRRSVKGGRDTAPHGKLIIFGVGGSRVQVPPLPHALERAGQPFCTPDGASMTSLLGCRENPSCEIALWLRDAL